MYPQATNGSGEFVLPNLLVPSGWVKLRNCAARQSLRDQPCHWEL